MAYESTWTFDVNVTPTDQTTLTKQCQSFLLQLKNWLVTSGWTVVYSSNATTANTSDNWTTIADLVRAAAGSNHSHVTLKSPIGMYAGSSTFDYLGDQSRVWMTLDWSTTTDYTITVRWHNSAPTGGSLTAVQISTNQVGFASLQFMRSVLNTATFHFSKVGNGGFYSATTYSGAGRAPFYMHCMSTLSPSRNVSNQDHPYGISLIAVYSDTGNGAPIYANWSSTNLVGWSHDGTAGAPSAMCLYSMGSAGTLGPMGITGAAAGDAWASKVDFSPVYVWNTTTSKTARIGRLPDLFITGNANVNGSTDAATVAWEVIGSAFLPTNAAWNW